MENNQKQHAVPCAQEMRLGNIEVVLANISETLKELKALLTSVARQEERLNTLQRAVNVLQQREYEAAKQHSSGKWVISLVQTVVVAVCVSLATLTLKKGG